MSPGFSRIAETPVTAHEYFANVCFVSIFSQTSSRRDEIVHTIGQLTILQSPTTFLCFDSCFSRLNSTFLFADGPAAYIASSQDLLFVMRVFTFSQVTST